jgi:monovalent cation:H+ antiporter, CPA1 family
MSVRARRRSALFIAEPHAIKKIIMDESLRQIVGMVAVAMIVALAARRFKLPYTVGLVMVGAVLALSKADLGFPLTRDLIFDLILPPLLFEAAVNIPWPELRRDILPILVLSTFGTFVSAVVVASGMAWLLGWPTPSALVFGALIAATDPVRSEKQ